MFKGIFSKRRFVGLDIGASSVKAVELSGKSNKLTLTGLGTEPLAPDTIYDGQILDHAETARAISELFSDHHLGTQNIASSVSGYSAILKNITVPPMTEEEFSEGLDWYVEEYIPFDISDVRIDYQILGSDENSLQVMLAACKLERIENLKETLKRAGQRAEVIDFDTLALQNCYTFNYQPADDSPVMLLHIGASEMMINIVRGCRQDFLREASIGGDDYTNLIRKELGLTFEQAEAVKIGGIWEIEIEGTRSGEAVGVIPRHRIVETDFELMVETMSSQLLLEIQRSLDFWRATSAEREANVQKILISGGGSKLKGLKEYLSRRLEMPVETLYPFRRIKTDARRFSPEYLSEIAPEMSVAVGLALRGTDAPVLSINLADSGAEKKRVALAILKRTKKEIKESAKRGTKKVYLYKGRNRLNEVIIGERAAKNHEDLRESLRREQIILTAVSREAPLQFLSLSGWRRKKVSAAELASFTGWLALMIDFGAPLLWCLESFAQEQKNKYFKQVLGEIISDVGQGSTMSSAMSRYPEVFDEGFVNICEAGETCGIIDSVLKRLQSDLEARVKLWRSLRLMILYPIALLASATVILMLSVMAALHNAPAESLGRNGYLRFWGGVITSTGAFLGSAGGIIVLTVVIVALLSLGLYIKTERGRRQKDELLLRIPFLGAFLHKIYIARFARRLSTLLSSGVPILASLDNTAKEVGNSVFAEAIKTLRDGVERGQTFTDSMSEVFPAVVKQVLGYGEMTGGVDTALSKIADLYEEDVNKTLSRLPLVLLPIGIALFVLIAINLLLIAR